MEPLPSEPLVSVITPVYNGEQFLSECIESVLDQSYQNWDYVLVDNCSTDGTRGIGRRYADDDPRIQCVHYEEHLDIIANWNRALRHVAEQARYVKILHADDLLFPDCLARMVRLAEANPNVGLVGAYRLSGRRVSLDELPYGTQVIDGRKLASQSLRGETRLLHGSPTAYLLRASEVRKHNPFYDEEELHSDRGSCYKVLKTTDFGFVHQVLTLTRDHEESFSRRLAIRLYTYRVANLYILKEYGPNFLDPAEFDERYEKELRDYYRLLARHLLRPGSSEFWAYHRQRLEEIGEPLNRTRLAASLGRWLLGRIVAPVDLARSVGRKMQGAR